MESNGELSQDAAPLFQQSTPTSVDQTTALRRCWRSYQSAVSNATPHV